ncbi:UNVERIFIED_CONTAM: hypothetical protein HDU68_006965 [Siphonaria sp. JEL0065]|nr:hypothetical protein HDU68_006965 [Siphonaria sp. JEL0065]
MIPVTLLVSGWGVCIAQNMGSPLFAWRVRGPQADNQQQHQQQQQQPQRDVEACTLCWEKVRLHPHHWAIFYSIAFFTRFDNIASNIAAGLCLGSYVHGIAAYGHDHLLEK